MKTEKGNFSKQYDLIPEDHIIIGWGYPEPDMDWEGNMHRIPIFDLTDSFTEGDVSDQEISWLEGIVGTGSTRCTHCGKSMKYFALVKDQESGRAHIIGTQCASSMIGYQQEKVDAMHRKTLKARQKVNRVKKERKAKADAQAFLAANKGLEKALEVDHYISRDLSSKCHQYGSLSEAQIKLAFKLEKQVAERTKEQAERAEKAASREYFGEIGERVRERKLKMVFATGFDTDFGYMYINKFEDEEGNAFTYKGSAGWGREYEGRVSFTIKDHSEYRGEKQTLISRLHDHEYADEMKRQRETEKKEKA